MEKWEGQGVALDTDAATPGALGNTLSPADRGDVTVQAADGASESEPARLSDDLDRWLRDGDTTLGGLVDLFGEKSFALVFVLLMAVPALPLPTGGATHVFEVVVALVAVQLIVGRKEVWIPRRWRHLRVAGEGGEGRFIRALLRVIRGLERISRPRFAFLFGRRVTNVIFGVLVIGGCVGAFVAPPFTGLDTLPAMGVVLVSLGVLMEDVLVVVVGVAVGVLGVALEVFLGKAAVHAAREWF